MRFLSDIADFITDEKLLAGVATGVSEQIDRSEARRDKTLDQLRTYGLEKTNRQEQEYLNDLDENEEQVKLLAAKLATPDNPANSQQVLAAAQYLIQNFTLAGGQAEADRLRQQYLKFNLNPLVEIGQAATDNGVTLSVRDIASGLTRRPAPVNVSQSGFPVKPSFLDRVFGGPTVEEEAQQSINAMQSLIPEQDVLPVIADTGYDADLIIRDGVPIRQEINRFKELMADAQASRNVPKQKLIASKILVLEEDEIMGRRAEAKEFTDTQFNRTNGTVVETIGNIYELNTKGNLLLGERVTFEESNEATKEAIEFASKATVDLSDIQKSGNSNMSAEREKITTAVLTNRAYKVVEKQIVVGVGDINQETRTYGILTIELLDDTPLFKNEYFTTYLSDRQVDDTILSGASGADQSEIDANAGQGGSVSAYIPNGSVIADGPTTGVNLTTKAITDAVAAFNNLPPGAIAPDKAAARLALQKAIRDANPGMKPQEVRKQANILLGE